MDGMTLFIVFIVAIFGVAFAQIHAVGKKKAKMETQLSAQPGFKATQKLMGENGETGLAIDENSKKICLIDNTSLNTTTRIFSYKDVLSCEIFSDGDTITKTSRTSQAGGALIGGILLGGVGAIIGGLSGKTKSIEKVKKLDLRIVVNDTAKPIHDVNLLNLESKKDGFLYKTAMEKARHWHSLVAVLIRRADEEDKAKEKNAQPVEKNKSVADELSKLMELKEKGILTDEEFTQQKLKLLS